MAITAMDFDKLVIDKIDMVTAIDKATGECMFMFDEIKDGTITNGSEKVYGTGAGGVRLSALNRNKTASFSCSNGYLIGGAIAAQTGTDVEVASEENKLRVPIVEILEVKNGAPDEVELSQVPVGAVGAEIPFIYKAQKDNTQGEKFSIGNVASDTEFALEPATKKITLPTGKFDVGDRVIVIYTYETTVGKKLSNKGDSYARNCELFIDILCRDVCNNDILYHTKFVFPSASIDGNFDIVFGDEPSVHNFSAEALQNVCAKDKTLWDWYIVEG